MHAESLVRAFMKRCASSSVVGQKRERQAIRDGFEHLLPEQANPAFTQGQNSVGATRSMISPEVVRQVRVMILLECAKREIERERSEISLLHLVRATTALQQKPNSLKRLRVLRLYRLAKESSRRHRQTEKQTSQRLQPLLRWGTKSIYCSKLLLLPARSLTVVFAQRRQDVPDTFMRQRHFYPAAQRSVNQVSDRKLSVACLLA